MFCGKHDWVTHGEFPTARSISTSVTYRWLIGGWHFILVENVTLFLFKSSSNVLNSQ